MLLRIEVFPPAGKAPSQTLYVSPSTVEHRYGKKVEDNTDDDATVDEEQSSNSNSSNPNAGLVATIGRKGDVDILFGTDRSISRQHALLRFVAPKVEAKKRKARGRKASSNPADAAVANQGCFMEPRNKDEVSACKESPYGMCLVLENKGKSGSYVPSRDNETSASNPKEDHDSDATTDDEGAGGVAGNSSNYGTATSLTTQLGEVIVSRNKLSSSQKLPSLSDAIQDHFGSETPVKLTKLDADESLVLAFDGSFGKEDSNSVLVQFGCAQLPTIQITQIPMKVVFSSGVAMEIQDSLRLCGGLSQDSLPSRQEGTTHLVATERMPVAKQLIAWCYKVPIVAPDFLVAMRNHSSIHDPFPLASDFFPKATDTNDFWEWTPNPQLLSEYTMVSVDPSPEVEQAEGLALAAGATLERLYDNPKKKPTKAKVQAFVKRAMELLDTSRTVVLLSSKTKSKWANNNTANFLKQLQEELSIPPVGSKILAKTITKQESFLVGLEPSGTSNTNSAASSKSTKEKAVKDSTITSETSMIDAPTTPQDGGSPPDSPEWQLRKTEKPSLEREHEQVCKEKANMEDHSADIHTSSSMEIHTDEYHTALEEVPSDSRSSKRRKVDQRREKEPIVEEEETDFVLPVDKDESVPLTTRSSDKTQSSKSHNNNKQKNSTSSNTKSFEEADSNGWLTAAPKDDRERSRWRQRASKVYQKMTGIALEPSAPTGVIIHVTETMTDSTNHRSNNDRGDYANFGQKNSANLPNFKRFRKNHVPRTEEVVLLVDELASNAQKATEEASAEELELREAQRVAEALFRGEPVPGMVKKRRRARD